MSVDSIPRQTQARRQIRRVTLEVEAHEDGTYVVTAPGARGWRKQVRTNPEAGAAFHEALVEAQIAAYARAHGQVYDHDAATAVDPDTPSTQVASRVTKHLKGSRVSPGWEEQEDGTWLSPAGLTFSAETQMVRRVVEARNRADAEAQARGQSPSPLPPDRG